MNSLAESAESATFPTVPKHLRMDRASSVEEPKFHEDKRRSTFKSPYNPDGKFSKDRHNEDNFTFSKRGDETDPNIKNYMKSAENPFKALMK